MDFILYKLGDSFVIDFNNLESDPGIGALDILGGMKTLLEDYLRRTNASAEQCLDITDRILGLIREHTEKRVMSLKWDEAIDQMNSEIAKGKPISEDEGDRRIALAEREARSWILEGKGPEAKFFDVIQDSKTVVVDTRGNKIKSCTEEQYIHALEQENARLKNQLDWMADELAELDCPHYCPVEESPALEECAVCWKEAARKATEGNNGSN